MEGTFSIFKKKIQENDQSYFEKKLVIGLGDRDLDILKLVFFCDRDSMSTKIKEFVQSPFLSTQTWGSGQALSLSVCSGGD